MWEGMQQLTPLLPVSQNLTSAPRFLAVSGRTWAILQEPPWTTVTPMDAVLVFRFVPFNIHHEHLVMFMCLFISEDAWQWRPKGWLCVAAPPLLSS